MCVHASVCARVSVRVGEGSCGLGSCGCGLGSCELGSVRMCVCARASEGSCG